MPEDTRETCSCKVQGIILCAMFDYQEFNEAFGKKCP